jgi:hypothetical protein
LVQVALRSQGIYAMSRVGYIAATYIKIHFHKPLAALVDVESPGCKDQAKFEVETGLVKVFATKFRFPAHVELSTEGQNCDLHFLGLVRERPKLHCKAGHDVLVGCCVGFMSLLVTRCLLQIAMVNLCQLLVGL